MKNDDMEIHSFSHQGKKKSQEDAFLIIEDQKLFVICDGVGSSSNGAWASNFIINYIRENSIKYQNDISSLIIDATNALEYQSISEGILTEIATTIVIAKINENSVISTHLGDSKFMFFSEMDASKNFISQDHSLVEELKSAGVLKGNENSFPFKNMITKCISNHKSLHNEDFKTTEIFGLKPGDKIFLCSDGALENIGPNELVSLFVKNFEDTNTNWTYFSDLCKNHSKDNASCIMIQI